MDSTNAAWLPARIDWHGMKPCEVIAVARELEEYLRGLIALRPPAALAPAALVAIEERCDEALDCLRQRSPRTGERAA